MSAETQFKDFIERQRSAAAETAAAETATNWHKEKDEWLSRLDELYETVTSCLEDYMKDGFVSISRKQIELTEDYVGTYEATSLEIAIGPQIITLTPVGTFLVGSKGRVDVEGSAGSSRIILIGKYVNDPHTMSRAQIPAGPPVGPEGGRRPMAIDQFGWVWKIVSRPPAMRFLELNRDSFLEMLMEVSNA